jgi:hypothetical protein
MRELSRRRIFVLILVKEYEVLSLRLGLGRPWDLA